MKKILWIVAVLSLIPGIASAVILRENEKGQKLVTKMTVTKNDANGQRREDYKMVYEFTYDDSTDELLKVVRTIDDNGETYKEILERIGDKLQYSSYIDDTLQTDLKREYNFSPKEGKIWLYKQTRNYEQKGGIGRSIYIVKYSVSYDRGYYRALLCLGASNTVYNTIRDIRYGDDDIFYATGPKILTFLGFDQTKDLGFKNGLNYLIDENNVMYSIIDYKEEPFFYYKGDVVSLKTLDLGNLETGKGDPINEVYSDMENPTNINFLPLARMYADFRNEMVDCIETVTPWYFLSSKRLPLQLNSNYNKKFEYDINWKGYLENIKITDLQGRNGNAVFVELEYECDLRGFETDDE